MKFGKKSIVVFIVVLLILLFSFYYYVNYFSNEVDDAHSLEPLFENNTARIFSNENEEKAIHQIENLDLEKHGLEDGPLLINKKTIDNHQNQLSSLKDDNVKVHAYFNYFAEADEYSSFEVIYDNLSHTIKIGDILYAINFQVDTVYPTEIFYAIFVNDHNEILTNKTQSVKLNFSKGYIVKQHYDYEEYYGPLNAFGYGAEQMIVLDNNYQPKLIVYRETGAWIS